MNKFRFFLNAALIVLFALNFSNVIAQNDEVCLGSDLIGCPGQPVTINICNLGLDSNTQLDLPNPTVIPQLSDDTWSGVHPIGFTFNLYGNDFTQFIIGSNGLISFNIGQAGQACPYALTAVGPLPSTGGGAAQAARNSVMGAYTDINPSAAGNVGNIQYQTLGQAPNRMLVVLFRELGAFQCNQSVCHNFSIILYETSNVVEVHLGSKPICGSWNGGLAIQGLQNSTGTVAHITPGRNNTQWTAFEDSRRYTPLAPSNTLDYAITVVDYLHVTGIGSSIVWANTLNSTTFPYNNGILNTTIPASDSVGYYLSGTSCGLAIGGLSDTTYLIASLASVDFDITPDACFSSIGSVNANISGTSPPFEIAWGNGETTNTINNLLADTYTLTVTDAIGCVTNYIVVVPDEVGLLPAVGTVNDVSCNGLSDGSIEMAVTGGTAPYSYTVNGTNLGTNSLIDDLSSGEYTIIVTDANGCSGEVLAIVNQPILIPATIIYPTSPICSYENGNVVITGVQGGNFSASPSGLNLETTGNLAGVVTGPGSQPGNYIVTYTYTNPNGCVYQTTAPIVVLPPANISAGIDASICDFDPYTLSAAGGVQYQWQGGFSNGQTITPSAGTNTYVVLGTDANGCQGIDSVTVIVVPYPTISFTQDLTEGYPVLTVNFTNTSSPGATNFVWNFGNGTLASNNTNVANPYATPGVYTVTLTGEFNGCFASANSTVTVFNFDPPIIEAPNVFSPNGDDTNEAWHFIIFENVAEIDFAIINRWGNVVFESTELNLSWDGKTQSGSDAEEGVYFYKYTVIGLNGLEYTGHGHLTLVRQ